MTTATERKDFSNVGAAATQCAAEKLMEEKLEGEVARISWLYWEVLFKRKLTDRKGVRQLAQWSDRQTLGHLSTFWERIGVSIGIFSPQSAVVQPNDLERITTLLDKANVLANTPGSLETWASRPQRPTLFRISKG